jgi:hypothetical protein
MSDPTAELPPSPSERGGDIVFESKRFRVVRIAEPLNAGADAPRRSRDVIEHPGSVVVVPMVSPREVCLVEVVRVAVGRDFGDVTPLRGVIRGGGGRHTLAVAVRTRRLDAAAEAPPQRARELLIPRPMENTRS